MTNTIRTNIICKSAHDRLEFFACTGGEEFYLFSQRFDRAVFARFKKGVELSEALTPIKRRGRNLPLEKVSDKLPAYIRYVEQEYGVSLLRGRAAGDSRRTLLEKAEKDDLRYAA